MASQARKEQSAKSRGWNPSTTLKSSSPLRMAEPVHRIPPPGATNFQSVRSVSKSSLQLVKEICLHYVGKCAGQYSDNKAASRYIHQMAEEIIFQLGGVANEIQRTRGEPELYQSLLDEWNEHFPPTLGAVGSPKAIAQLVAAQSKEITRLKNELQSEKLNRENDVVGILKSMDAQLHTYRSSVMSDRKQQKLLFDQQANDYEEKIRLLKEHHEINMKNLESAHKENIVALRKQCDLLQKQGLTDQDKLAKHQQIIVKQLRVKYHDKIERLRNRIVWWDEKCKDLRAKYNELAVTLSEDLISTTDSDPVLEDDLDVLSDIDDEPDGLFDHETESSVQVSDALRIIEENRSKKKQARELAANAREVFFRNQPVPEVQSEVMDAEKAEKIRQLHEANIIQNAQVKRMEKKLSETQGEVLQKQQEINILTQKILDFVEQQAELVKKFKALEELNEHLRRALVARVDKNGCLCVDGADKLKTVSDVLCHTPHFLEKPDRLAPSRKSQPILSGYKISGCF